MERTTAAAVTVCVAALVLSAVAGCGPAGPARHPVEGAVTYAGKPLPRGTIRFDPDGTKGNTGPVGMAEIVDGRYATKADGGRGPLQGPLVVWISGYPPADPAKEFQPPLFSDYRVEIKLEPSASGPTQLDFDVPAQRRP
jgi:hypothetical protein